MRWGAIAGVSGAAALIAATVAFAQPAPPSEQQRLIDAKRASEAAQERSASLEQQAAAESDAARKARAEEAAVAARIEGAQADIAAAQARVSIVEQALAQQRARLAVQRTPIARLIAALADLTRRPAAVSLVQPGSVDDVVYVRAVLGTVTPYIERRTAAVRAELAHTAAIRADAALAAQSLVDSRARLDDQRLALARLEAAHAGRSTRLGREALAESDRAIALGERARDLVDEMQLSRDQTTTAAALDGLPGPAPRPFAVGITPAAAGWDAATAPYRLPVTGKVVTGLGELADSGFSARGLTLRVAPGARIAVPADGTIAYARPFLDYGTVVIVDHGGGWTTLITGLARADVVKGARVSQGQPIGVASSGEDPRVTVELRRNGRPIDMTGLLG